MATTTQVQDEAALAYSNPPILEAIAKRPMLLIGPVIAIVAVVAVVALFMNHRNTESQAANNRFFSAQKVYDAETKAFAASVPPSAATAADAAKKAASPLAAKPNQEDVLFKKTDVEAKFSGTIQGFKEVIDSFPGTRAAFEAELTLGALYMNHGSPAKAVEWLAKAASAGPSALDTQMALSDLGAAQEGAGQYADAVATYQNAISRLPSTPDLSLKADLLMGVARSAQAKGDKQLARTTYDQVISQMPESTQAREAGLLKALIQ